MDVTLGATVEGTAAQIALLDAVAPHKVIDQFQMDLTGGSLADLVSTVTSTDRMLADAGHRLVDTTVCSSNAETATRLRDALVDADLTRVTVVSQSDAVTAVTRSMVGDETAASLVSDDETAALSIVDSAADTTSLIAVEPVSNGDRGTAYRTLLERFSEEPGGATSVIVLGAPIDDGLTADLNKTSPVPLRFPDAPEFALARGAALAGFRPQPVAPVVEHYPDDSLDSANTVLGPQAQQLAYSQVDDVEDYGLAGGVPLQTPMQPLSAVGPDEYEAEEEEGPPANRPQALLLGSTVAAVVVVGFAALAVTVALNIRPDVNEQPVRLAEESVTGKYFPVAPGQGVAPDGPAWTMIEEVPPAGTVPESRTFRTHQLGSSNGTGDAGAEVIKLFRDGTVGIVPDVGPIPPVGNVAVPAGFPQPTDFVTRLIPDFSRWNPCQVLALVSNMRLMGEAAADTVSSVARAGNVIPDLEDIGRVAVVRGDKGALFNTAGDGDGATTDITAIPQDIFKTGGLETAASEVLPSDTKIVDTSALESLPVGDPATAPSESILGQVLPPDVGEALPGTRGTAPIVKPDLKVPESVGGSTPDTVRDIPEVTSGDRLPGESTPKVGVPDLPDGSPPKVDQLPVPKPEDVLAPKPADVPPPKVDIPAPKVDIPVPEVEAPAPKVDIPAPKVEIPAPKVEVPAPKVEVPVQQAPVIEAPAPPPVQAPSLPSIDLPTQLPIPKPQAPVSEAPSVPDAPSVPTLPELPFGGGLFGSGSG